MYEFIFVVTATENLIKRFPQFFTLRAMFFRRIIFSIYPFIFQVWFILIFVAIEKKTNKWLQWFNEWMTGVTIIMPHHLNISQDLSRLLTLTLCTVFVFFIFVLLNASQGTQHPLTIALFSITWKTQIILMFYVNNLHIIFILTYILLV